MIYSLTDIGLLAILEGLRGRTSIRELYLDQNDFGPRATQALVNLVTGRNCHWSLLHLSQANFRNADCVALADSLHSNLSLTDLDLSRNSIGHTDSLQATHRGAVVAIAEVLESMNCHLQKLNLAWNLIRDNSAQRLSQAFLLNHSITFLDVSSNRLGEIGAYQLADALQWNKTLNHLNLANNGIASCAGM